MFRVFWYYNRKLNKELTAGVFYIRRNSGRHLHDVCSNLLRRDKFALAF